MASFVEIIGTVIFLLPVYAILIWSYLEPEKSKFMGRRWMYKEEPEASPKAIRYTKFAAMTAMIGIPFILLSFYTDNMLRFIPLIFIFIIVFGGLKILLSQD